MTLLLSNLAVNTQNQKASVITTLEFSCYMLQVVTLYHDHVALVIGFS